MAIVRIELDGGREIRATSVHISETYAGMLEGYPNARSNDILVSKIPLWATHYFFGEWPVVLVGPARRLDPNMSAEPWGPAEYLPDFWIAGHFESLPIEESNHGSSLILVWFQEEPVPFPSTSVLPALREIDWSMEARDFEY